MPVQSTCERCGASFRAKDAHHARFCTKKCAAQRQTDNAQYHRSRGACLHCGAAFAWRTDLQVAPKEFCGLKCKRAHRPPVLTRPCELCGSIFSVPLKNQKKRFCSSRCVNEDQHRHAKPLEVRRAIANARHMARYHDLKAAGICPQCGRNPIAPPLVWCQECRLKFNRRVREALPEKQKRWDKADRIALHAKAIRAYGGRCACCGETHMSYLTLDHINNDGKQHRAELGVYGMRFYAALKRLGYPSCGVQVLCANCHMAKTRSVECADHHQ